MRMQASAGVSEMHHSHQLHLLPDIISALRSSFHFPCWSPFLPPAHYLWQHSGRFHFHPLVYFFAYLSAALVAHQRTFSRELRASWGSCKRLWEIWQTAFMFSCDAAATTDAVACASVLHNLPPIWETWQPPASPSLWLPFNFRRSRCLFFFSLPAGPQRLFEQKEKKINLQPRKKRQIDKEPFPPSLAPYGSASKSTNWDSIKGNKQLYFIQLGWKTTEGENRCWGDREGGFLFSDFNWKVPYCTYFQIFFFILNQKKKSHSLQKKSSTLSLQFAGFCRNAQF